MSGFTPDQLDFLTGGLMKAQMAGVSAMSGGAPVIPLYPAQSPFAASLYTAYRASTIGVIKSSVGTVYSLAGYNVSANAPRYLQLHNSASVVASGAVPLYSFQVAAAPGQTIVGTEFFTDLGHNFGLGVVYAWSTTPQSFTPATGAHHGVAVRLK